MKKTILLSFASLILLWSCNKEDTPSYPASDAPRIEVASDALYSVPNRKFTIKAQLTDDLGLATVHIAIPKLFLDKTIALSKDTLLKSYSLEYQFLAPTWTKSDEVYEVDLRVTDVSGNVVDKRLTLHLDGDFDAPSLSALKPANGTAIFKVDDTKLNVSFTLTDATGVDYFVVQVKELGIYDSLSFANTMTLGYNYSKSFSIPNTLKEYELLITTKDNFVLPNIKETKVKFSVVEGLPVMYLADVPKSTNLTADIFGVPMYYHEKNGDEFLFKYYADSDNKQIYLLGQDVSFEPHCFGLNAIGGLENSSNALPIVLPQKGYYKVLINPLLMTYSVEAYTPTSTPMDLVNSPMSYAGSGADGNNWDPNNMKYPFKASTANPYLLYVDLNLNGDDVNATLGTKGWGSPFFRIGDNATVVLNGGDNHAYKSTTTGVYTLWLDTELERVKLIKK